MKTGRQWWVLIGMILIWALPILYASVQILLSIGDWRSIAEFYQPLLGTIALVLSGLMPFFFLLPSLLTDVTEDFIRQRGLFVRKEINWSDIKSLYINEHEEVIISSHRESIRFSLHLCKNPKDELTNMLSLSALQKAKEKMDSENRFYLEKVTKRFAES